MATDNTLDLDYRQTAQHVEVRYSKVFEAAALAQNEIVEMINVFRGDRVVDVILVADALGANSSLSVGDGGNAARFITTTTTTSATTTHLNSAADVGPMYQYTADDTIDVKVVGSGAITGTVRLVALISRDVVAA